MLARLRDSVARLPPAAALLRLYDRRPFFTAWLVLAAGMPWPCSSSGATSA